MKFPNTQKQADKYARSIERQLKAFIKERDHIDTGSLYNSIKVNINFNDGDIDIEMIANDYLVYLDKGDFIREFLSDKLTNLPQEITDAIAEDILIDLLQY
jgi:hypothetical protein